MLRLNGCLFTSVIRSWSLFFVYRAKKNTRPACSALGQCKTVQCQSYYVCCRVVRPRTSYKISWDFLDISKYELVKPSFFDWCSFSGWNVLKHHWHRLQIGFKHGSLWLTPAWLLLAGSLWRRVWGKQPEWIDLITCAICVVNWQWPIDQLAARMAERFWIYLSSPVW